MNEVIITSFIGAGVGTILGACIMNLIKEAQITGIRENMNNISDNYRYYFDLSNERGAEISRLRRKIEKLEEEK